MLTVIKTFAILDGKNYSSDNTLKNGEVSYTFGPISICIRNNFKKICTSINNISSHEVNINKIELELFNVDKDLYESFILNSENSADDIDLNLIKGSKSDKLYNSFLYTYLSATNLYENIFLGFLSSHLSRNYIKIISNGDKITVKIVFDFTNHCLKPAEELNLDVIYFDFNKDISESLNSYFILINDGCLEEHGRLNILVKSEALIDQKPLDILFEEKVSKITLIKGGKPYSIKLNGKKLYPIDISKQDGKSFIMDKLKELSGTRDSIVYFNNIIPYINAIVQNRAFNPYYELSNLLKEIKKEFNYNISFKDCPLGIAIGYMNIINDTLDLEPVKKSYLINMIKRKENSNDLNYNFIIKTILHRRLFVNNSNFISSSSKIRKAMDVISQNINTASLEDENVLNMFSDINRDNDVIAYIGKEEVFSVLRQGWDSYYIAIFNLTDKKANFYWDMSKAIDKNLDGSSVDVLNNKTYLIVNNKIYIKNILPMDCCLIRCKGYSELSNDTSREINQITKDVI